MSAFVKSAKVIHDIESDLTYVEIMYDKYTKDRGYTTFTDYINTESTANWIHIESKKHSLVYEKFLDTMVKKTFDVWQRMAELTFDTIMLYEQPNEVIVRLVHAIKILDPSFQPPRISMSTDWQMDIMTTMCNTCIPQAIQSCTEPSRLEYFSKVLKLIELEQ